MSPAQRRPVEPEGAAAGPGGVTAGSALPAARPATETVPAVGGMHEVPVPDPVARDYILLALRLDQHIPGLVDGYFGPASLKAQVDMEQLRSPARLAEDAAVLRDRVSGEVPEPDRRDWLDAQLLALETQAAARASSPLPYLEHVTRCFQWAPRRRPDARFESAAAELDGLLPGEGPVAARLQALDEAWTIPVERLSSVIDALLPRLRARSAELFGLPDGEHLRVSLVRDQPWGAYNWYDGGLGSRVDVNTDLAVRLPSFLSTLTHETYPGHHLEHAWKEAELVMGNARLEASVLCINTPECLVSEGLGNVARDFSVPIAERAPLLAELATLAALPVAADPARLDEAATIQVRAAELRSILGEAGLNAALLRHVDGLDRGPVIEYLVEVGRFAPDVAAKRLDFIDHPLWRTYIPVYSEGEALLRRWLGGVEAAERAARFARLLREQLTPAAIARELSPGATLSGGSGDVSEP
jgi:hypothetical protein